MYRQMGISLAFFIVAAALTACGGGQKKSLKDRELEKIPDDVDPITHIVGEVDEVALNEAEEQSQTSTEQAAQEEEEQKPAEPVIKGGKGALLVDLKVTGQTVTGTYRVVTVADNPTVIKDKIPTGTQVELNPGVYDVIIISKDVISSPEWILREVEIPEGQLVKREHQAKVGELTLINGTTGCKKAPLKIKAKGATDWLEGKFQTCVPLLLPAGEYEAMLYNTPISGIKVYDGGVLKKQIRKGAQ